MMMDEDLKWRCLCLCRSSSLQNIPEIVSVIEEMISSNSEAEVLSWFVRECLNDPCATVYPRNDIFDRYVVAFLNGSDPIFPKTCMYSF